MRLVDGCNVEVMVFSSVTWKTLLEYMVVGIRRFLNIIFSDEENNCVTVDMTVVVNTVVAAWFGSVWLLFKSWLQSGINGCWVVVCIDWIVDINNWSSNLLSRAFCWHWALAVNEMGEKENIDLQVLKRYKQLARLNEHSTREPLRISKESETIPKISMINGL